MDILSYNIRGLGSRAKSKETRDLIKCHKVDVCCVQETKKETVDEFLARSIWGAGKVGWGYKEAWEVSGYCDFMEC
ncbi:hypothetical protein ACS0TY_021989 [Phlomoides rotata]